MATRTHLPIYLLVLISAAGAGYAVGRFTTEPVVEVIPERTESAVKVSTTSANPDLAKALSEVDALRNENKNLRQQLKQRPEAMEEGPVVEQPEAGEPRRQSRRDRLEELKETDPEAYKKEMERREQFASAMKQMSEDRNLFLHSIDTSLLTPEAQENHYRFTAAMAKQAELQEQMMALRMSGEEIPETLREEMGDVFREIQETREGEREALLNAIANSMGLVGDDADDFTALVNEVFNATGTQGPRMGRGGPGGPGGGPMGMGNPPPMSR